MEKNKMIKIKSLQRATVGLTVPYLNLRRTWERKGAVKQIPFELLSQAIFEPGVEYLFKSGVLFIDDLDARVALGLEEEGVTEETAKLFELTDEVAEQLLMKDSLPKFKEELEKFSRLQLLELSDIAIEKGLTDYEKTRVLKSKTGKDVLGIVIRNNQEAEADNQDKQD